MSELWVRILTGIVFVIVMIGGVIWNEYSFLLLFGIITALCIWEYHNIIDLILSGERSWRRSSKYINMGIGLVILVLFFVVGRQTIPLEYLLVIALFPCLWFIIEMYGKSTKPFINLAFNATALLYLAIPLSSASFIVFRNGEYTHQYLLAILFFAWANDSLAYVFGRLFGRIQLSPKYSPKKSVEGAIGGGISSLGFGYLAYVLIPLIFPDTTPTSLFHYLVLAAITSVMSNYGDLAESMLKRNLNVKDSVTFPPDSRLILIRFCEDLHFIGYHETGIKTQAEATYKTLAVLNILKFVKKFFSTGKGDLVDVFLYLLSSHTDAFIGYGQCFVFFINNNLNGSVTDFIGQLT